jgi:hypothetical protein
MQPRACSREGSLDYDVAAARRASFAFAFAPAAEYSSRTSSSASAPLGAAYGCVGAQARGTAAETDITLPSLHLHGLGQRTPTGMSIGTLSVPMPGAVGERTNTGTHSQKSSI